MDIFFIKEEIARAVVGAEEGDTPALLQYANICEIEKFIKEAKTQIWGVVNDELSNYPKQFEEYGYKFERREGGRLISYDNIKEVQDLKAALKECENRYKAALNASKSGVLGVSSETGEVLELPKVKFKKDSLIIKKL